MAIEQVTGSLHLTPVGRADLDSHIVEPGELLTLGRDSACEICLPEGSISRKHATIGNSEGQWLVTDIGSRHGTFLNGVRLARGQPFPADNDDLLRVGPVTFRLSLDTRGPTAMAATDDANASGTIVEPVPEAELNSLAHRRLALMIEGAAKIHEASNEEELAHAVLELGLAGTGFQRAAVLRYGGSTEEIEIVASRDHESGGFDGFSFSRSLLQASASGELARLAQSSEHNYGQSIERLGITAALCAPLTMAGTVVGALYLDSRWAASPCHPDAPAFCNAIVRLGSLALSSLKRASLEQRQQRLDAELKLAQEAQVFLTPPDRGSIGLVKFAARRYPGHVVAGDLFDIFEIGGGQVAICFGDVTGHGMAAALLMTAILSSLRAALARHEEPAAAVADVNTYVAERSQDNMFASLWVGVFDPANKVLRYVDAGHGHWALVKSGQPPKPGDRPANMLIGIDPDAPYTAAELDLQTGDRLVLFSDGVFEHFNMSREQFGKDRLFQAIAKSTSPDSDIEDALASLHEFMDGKSLDDDTTIASIEIG